MREHTGSIGAPPGVPERRCSEHRLHQSHGITDPNGSVWCPGVKPPSKCPCWPDLIDADCELHGVGRLTDQAIDRLLAEVEASPGVELSTQDELIVSVADLLEHALHADECYVNPDDTICFCVIGKLRDALPQCTATQTTPRGPLGQLTSRVWRCVRIHHPHLPDHHVFERA